MNKRLISYVTLAAFSLTTIPGKADVSEEIQHELNLNETKTIANAIIADDSADNAETDEDDSEPQGSEVAESSDSNKKAARKQMWINIGLAIAAVAVAVTALIIVSNNNGHHSH